MGKLMYFEKFRAWAVAIWQKIRPKSRLAYVMNSLLITFLLLCSLVYFAGVWYRRQASTTPLTWGVSWSYKFARELGVDPQAGLEAVASELPISRLRLMSYWDVHEATRGQYNWQELDEQIAIAEKYDKQVSLAIGLRQPRWPECHMPDWAKQLPADDWRKELQNYLQATVERYDSSPNVVEYQLENEFFTGFFGECPDHDRERLENEYSLVKSLTSKPIVITRSNNFLPSWPIGQPRADRTAFSIYKRVHNPVGYYEYPYPVWFYAGIAGLTKITTGVDTFIHELQVEPWGPVSTADLNDQEQQQSMDANRLSKRLSYAYATGMRTIDLWGAEWFYWRKTYWNDSSVWTTIQQELPKYK
ncbi:hypothetical protein KC878_04360 [Candidatus Saccharibacteria bacterium]|nr:hypothetical protein [Candidatus Saccharibacteria bacterium]MCB9821433.1 hypothetical protein [Candidatus Nomurabacteria bacterium]